jgi:NAD(P)-dependent dehydrogenase (short-subunit alcohol dehydrogenase family)
MGLIGEAEDVAGVALLLASPAGSFINGQVIGVGGGASAW